MLAQLGVVLLNQYFVVTLGNRFGIQTSKLKDHKRSSLLKPIFQYILLYSTCNKRKSQFFWLLPYF